MKRLLVILVMVVLGAALASAAQASSIQFLLTPGMGNISYTPPAPFEPPDPCIGMNLRVSTITAQGTPLNSGIPFIFPPDPCIVSFTTGLLTNSPSSSASSEWSFSVGGSIGAATVSNNPITYLTGVFLDPTLSSDSMGTSHEFLGTFTAQLGADLLTFYGIPGNPVFQGTVDIFATTITGIFPPNGIVTDPIVSGSLTLNPVPLPGTLPLLGGGLLGLVGWRRVKKS